MVLSLSGFLGMIPALSLILRLFLLRPGLIFNLFVVWLWVLITFATCVPSDSMRKMMHFQSVLTIILVMSSALLWRLIDMPFRERQFLRLYFPRTVVSPELVELPTGEYVTDMVDQCKKSMPDPALFELKNLVKAGVDLQEVNSKVLSPSSVDAQSVIRKYTKSSAPKSENENEVNNEN